MAYHYKVPFEVDLSVLSPAAQELAKANGFVQVAITGQEYADTLSLEDRKKEMSDPFFAGNRIIRTFNWDIRHIGNEVNLNL